MSKLEDITQHLDDLTVWSLARRADVFDPDGNATPGALFLSRVRDDVVELLEWWDTTDPDESDLLLDGGDDVHERADSAVPGYTHERWKVFTDLGAWTVDVSDYGPAEDMTTAAGIALFEVARTLIHELLGEAVEMARALEGDEEVSATDTV